MKIQFQCWLTVNDEQALRQAAYNSMLPFDEQASEYLDPEVMSAADCVQILLDPGQLAGCEILDSCAEADHV